MKKQSSKKKTALPIKDAFKVLSFIFAAIMISACSNKITFPTSDVIPAAEAVVKVDRNKNKNYEIELEIENIARPERLSPARTNYVVWMDTQQHGTVNLGNLRIDKNNSASLTTVTPYKPTRIFITAEDGQRVFQASTQVVLDSGNIEVK